MAVDADADNVKRRWSHGFSKKWKRLKHRFSVLSVAPVQEHSESRHPSTRASHRPAGKTMTHSTRVPTFAVHDEERSDVRGSLDSSWSSSSSCEKRASLVRSYSVLSMAPTSPLSPPPRHAHSPTGGIRVAPDATHHWRQFTSAEYLRLQPGTRLSMDASSATRFDEQDASLSSSSEAPPPVRDSLLIYQEDDPLMLRNNSSCVSTTSSLIPQAPLLSPNNDKIVPRTSISAPTSTLPFRTGTLGWTASYQNQQKQPPAIALPPLPAIHHHHLQNHHQNQQDMGRPSSPSSSSSSSLHRNASNASSLTCEIPLKERRRRRSPLLMQAGYDRLTLPIAHQQPDNDKHNDNEKEQLRRQAMHQLEGLSANRKIITMARIVSPRTLDQQLENPASTHLPTPSTSSSCQAPQSLSPLPKQSPSRQPFFPATPNSMES
ncbi:hypothetical protein BC940DRAFT_322265 [Gongronella butleri]|nr:hypothetical protein BC940DRAFT_322265 [Gongronella butleri]